jgi:hypothetical protein
MFHSDSTAMRKTLLYLILISITVIACKKEKRNSIPPVTGTQKVTFVAGFSQTTQSINSVGKITATNSLNLNSTPDTSLTNHINIIYYTVFDSVGNLLHNVYQVVGDTAFGRFVDDLHPGKYTVTISAGTTIGVASAATLSDTFIYGPGGINSSQGFTSDVFFKRITITVGYAAQTETVALNRITSRLIININDAIPANSNYALINISNVASNYYVGTDRIINVDGPGNNFGQYSYTIPVSAAGTKNYQIVTNFMYLNDFDVSIEIGQKTATGATVYGQRTVPNVTAAPNKITLLSGELFGGPTTGSTGGFQVTNDTTWNPKIVKTF